MICAALLILTLIYLQYRKSHKRRFPRNLVRILLLAEVLATVLSISEQMGVGALKALERPKLGEGEAENSLIVREGEHRYSYRLAVEPRELREDEVDACLSRALVDLKKIFPDGDLGEHSVTEDLPLPRELEAGQVSLSYSFEPEAVFEENGRFHRELIEEDTPVKMRVLMTCGARRLEEEFALLARAYPAESQEAR